MCNNTDPYISNSAMTANELHDIVLELCDIYHIDEFNNDVKPIIRAFTSPDDISDEYIEKKSYDIKSIIIGIGAKNDESYMSEWDARWNYAFDNRKHHDFIKAAILHRNTFQSVRASYLMQAVGRKALDSPPKNFGVLQLVCEKYIQDVLQFDGTPAEYFTVKYEDFDGDIESIQVRATKKHTIENEENKPQAYWLGKTLFDSFYMIPLLDNISGKWEMIPVDLIRSIKEGFKPQRWESMGDSDDI